MSDSCTTRTAAFSTCRSATPSAGPRRIEPSVGSRGDSYDNGLAETIIGLYKTELVLPRGPWSRLEDLELATLEWVWWFNNHRLLKPIGLVPPAEYEAAYYLRLPTPPELETLNTNGLR